MSTPCVYVLMNSGAAVFKELRVLGQIVASEPEACIQPKKQVCLYKKHERLLDVLLEYVSIYSLAHLSVLYGGWQKTFIISSNMIPAGLSMWLWRVFCKQLGQGQPTCQCLVLSWTLVHGM